MTMAELTRGVSKVLIEEDAVAARVAELGADVSTDYADKDLLLVGVLKGAVFFMADLMRQLTIPCEVDFMAISSYGASTDSSGVVRILKDLDINIEGRDVLVVEDIIDSGLTLSYLMRMLESRNPASLEVCALLTKPARREIDVPVRYTGFEIPNEFVIGYGLDFGERYRNLPYVAVLDPDAVLVRPAKSAIVWLKRRWYPADRESVNRFLRSALFPVVVITLIVWLGTQTLMNNHSKTKRETLSNLYTQRPDRAEKHQAGRLQPEQAPGPGGDARRDEVQRLLRERPVAGRPAEAARDATASQFDSKGIGTSAWWSILTSLLPFVLLFGFWIFLMNQVQGGGSKVMSFGKSRAKRMTPDSPKIGFKDVAGVDEAVEELQEIKEFLENPKKFQALGARIPKGVLLYGPPGTGKTLLARAVAGEAGVPFFSISGSDFVEMFVGVGASRVRDLFEQAKQASPCIVFMDEIDAVGRHRGAGLGGGHDEREQTLNQLLVEMDGFEMKDNIILIAATNRPDILDPALLRPGRFDRQIVVDRPDRSGRRKILEVHSKGKPLASEIDLDTLAAGTPGFTGADLANLVNEAALLAARRGKKTIQQDELEEGIMRVLAGPEKKARLLSEAERKITAYHEMGHALVGHYLENTNPVHKITIVSRGQALGLTISLPTEDKYLHVAQRAHGRPRDDARRPRRRGARLPRDHDRRRERPREGHAHREADDHALRHEREARPARPRPQQRHAVPRPRDGPRARLLGRGRARDRRGDPPRHRGGARPRDAHAPGAHGGAAPDLGDPDRARDDRQGSVRAADRRRGRGVGLPGRGAGAGAGAAGGAEAPAAAEAAPVPAAGRASSRRPHPSLRASARKGFARAIRPGRRALRACPFVATCRGRCFGYCVSSRAEPGRPSCKHPRVISIEERFCGLRLWASST